MREKIRIYPGQIVLAKHLDNFTGKKVIHPFLVWRSQGFKGSLKDNLYCFRITSNTEHSKADYWKVDVATTEENKLEINSSICTDAIFLFSKAKVEVIGQLNSSTFLKVINSRKKCAKVEEKEATHAYQNILNREMKQLKS